MNLIKITLVFALLLGCKTSSSTKNQNCNNFIEESWAPSDTIDTERDSISHVFLIFEKDFNDTLEIRLNKNLITKKFFKTNRNLSVVETVEKIKLDFLKDQINEITIVDKTNNECFAFKIKLGYIYYYIQKHDKIKWYLQYSNFTRKYY